MENITDLSELCRLCLEQSNCLISFDNELYFTTKTIPELVRFCLDINCNIGDGILPNNLCQNCLEKLQATFEFKHKSKESDKYLKEILLSHTEEVEAEEPQITPYNPGPPAFYDNEEDSDDLLEETYENKQVPDVVDNGSESFSSGNRSGSFPCTICNKVFRYAKPFRAHMKQHKTAGEFSQVVRPPPVEADSDDLSESMEMKKGQRLGCFPCSVCDKTFKYVKPFKTHMKQHQKGWITDGGNRRRALVKLKKGIKAMPNYQESQPQAPYDSRSPYDSPAPYASPVREESPELDMSMMLVNSNILNGEGDNDQPNGARTQKRTLLASMKPASPVPEEAATESRRSSRRRRSPEVEEREPTPPRREQKAKRSGGRPKSARIDGDNGESSTSFADFTEVDINSMLKSRETFYCEESISQSAPSTSHSRSRSSSVEMIQEFDIFGAAIPSPTKKKSEAVLIPCKVRGCDQKFHLRANLRKHQREVHSMV